jgi:integrase
MDPLGDTIADQAESASSKGTIVQSRSFKDGAIYLYQRSDYKKPTWLCRIKRPSQPGYVTRSTKTGDEHQAYSFADKLLLQLIAETFGKPLPTGKKIGPVIESYVRRLTSRSKQLSILFKIQLMNRIKPFLERKTFDDLDTSLISKLIDHLTEQSRTGHLSDNTIKRRFSDLRHFLNWCVDEGHLQAIPKFPQVGSERSRRPHFNKQDWQKLTRYLREFVKIENKAIRRDRLMLREYVLVLANTGIRVGEARRLKWRDISEVGGSDETTPHIVVMVTGKTGKREVVASSSDVKEYLKRIRDLRLKELTSPEKPQPSIDLDSFVFCHSDGSPVGSFKKSFHSLIMKAGVAKDSYGEVRTIYSLRHTYATFRLQNGVNHYSLAKNMGTSVAMIEQHYGHTTTIESAGELTKRIPQKKAGTASSLSWLD